MTGPKLLLADDSVTIRKVVELTFADEGIDVTTVADGDGAMSKFIDVQPDIVLVDVGLPGTNGYHICEMIKGDESTSHIPVLLLVGSFEPFDQDAAEKSGADGFLTKPFHSIRDLVNRVHELLGTQQQPASDEVIDFDTTVTADEFSDTEDINDLYERSFAETVPIENFPTVQAFEDEEEFPDEIASDEDASTVDEADKSEDERPEEESASQEDEQADDQPESVIESDTVGEGLRSASTFETDWLDDEMIETVSASSEEEVQTAEAVDAVSQYEEAPAAAVDIEPIKEFDWSPAAIVTATDEKEIGAAAGFSASFDATEPLIPAQSDDHGHITEELPDLKTDEMPEVAQETDNGRFALESQGADEPPDHVVPQGPAGQQPIADLSPELIEMITRRVIDRLSDRIIREVAQEAVPRIAEKMMREALEEDRNR